MDQERFIQKCIGRAVIPLAGMALLATALAFSCSKRISSLPLDAENTNVFWLTVCTLRADHLGAAGYEADTSPFIDSLAAGGVFFDRVLTAAPWTRASIASMITGVYPRTLDIESRTAGDPEKILADRFDTAAELFRSAGYATIGLTANPNTNRVFNFQQGFDQYQDTKKLWRNGYAAEKADGKKILDALLDQLGGPLRGKRFFAHAVIVDVHLPYLAEKAREKTGAFEPGTATAEYDRQIRYVDAVLSDFMKGLDSLGLDNTLVVVNSDHGEAFRKVRPYDVRHGKYLFNSTIWTPLLLSHPALEKCAMTHHEVIASVDILPTLLDLLGIPFDTDVVQGKSRKGAILAARSAGSDRDPHYVETSHQKVNRSALLTGGWKVIADYGFENRPDPKSVELYRFAEDPLEQNDRARIDSTTAADLLGRLQEWRESRDAEAAASPERAAISEEERRALDALGYIDR